jgi:hypothetical protein
MNDHSSELNTTQTVCVCKSVHGLFIPNRHLSILIALFMSIFVGTFLVGYFWGKRIALGSLIEKVTKDSFADQIYTSVCSLYDQYPESSTTDQISVSPEEASETEQLSTAEKPEKQYYAQVIGFGDIKNAQDFVARAKHKGFELTVEKKVSKTTKGKSIVWYQVVTAPVVNYDEMKNIVDRISKEEKIKGAQIIAC